MLGANIAVVCDGIPDYKLLEKVLLLCRFILPMCILCLIISNSIKGFLMMVILFSLSCV